MSFVKRAFKAGFGVADKSSAVAYYTAINCLVYCIFLKRIVFSEKCSKKRS